MSDFTDLPQALPAAVLNEAGLNRQAVFALAELPAEMRASLEAIAPLAGYRQLILIGQGGRRLWECVKASGIRSADPIDDFTVRTIAQCFAAHLPDNRYQLLYPSHHPIGLQQLGSLAGWHHASPFMVGIDAEWGSWSAYRAVVLADTRFPVSSPVHRSHPCSACRTQDCIAACPAGALGDGPFKLERCVAYRKQPDSACRTTCLARLACPVGVRHRYTDEQISHSYSISLRMIEEFY
ncbi:hypothetical protein AT959_16040 [Dechloromonas denitrificans]|uniref:4Fe-4S ferredoxin-type domain-containing protein n=1 Tax=Dechloromonas denitrificans TaxID=281362 RepID=A0A133XEU5_9RHOO|nr:hypothetical protein [Dechloromonas denitrificans]KXB29461.1 hypothetical protein AT959_16040 [Dechloromonas denitrificans]